ncbi:DUF3857 domain-containing protein [Flavitalea flava]
MNLIKQSLFILACLALGQATGFAQEKSPAKFGKISPADFDLSKNIFDTGATAVVIADIGNSEFEGNVKGWFSLKFKHFKRIKILNKNGFGAATVEIPLYANGNAVEKLEGLKAVTYNLENGKVVETRLEDKSIFTDKVNKNLVEKKFTFPAIKEGSIIEYTFTQSSDFLFNLQPWAFQSEYPCIWSEYEVDMPKFFQYVTITQGNNPYSINTNSSRRVNFRMTEPGGAERNENYSFEDEVVDHRWVMKNVPALKEERFTTTLNNYIAKIEFQLSRYNFPNMATKDIMGNWSSLSEGFMKDEDFGLDLNKSNSWLNDTLKLITKGASGKKEKAVKIFNYVRDHFTCTDHASKYLSRPLKTTFKEKNGNVADLNLLLAAMLIHEGITTDPVILSTRAHGFTHEIYPLQNRFNYVICQALIDSSLYYLDASHSWIGFGHLPPYCYNGHARVINKDQPTPVYFDADSITEGKTTMVFITNGGSKGVFSGTFQTVPGYFESCQVREKVHEKGEKVFFKAIQSAYTSETEISHPAIDSIKMQDMPVAVSYDFKISNDSNENLIYFNPLLSEGYKENPFSSAERRYPVEMDCATDETYIFNMEIPDGYTVDELPKSTKVLFNEDEGFFEYLVAKDENNIQLRSRIKLKKANFKPEDYATLRDFYGFIVKKQSEQIVFKKKNK